MRGFPFCCAWVGWVQIPEMRSFQNIPDNGLLEIITHNICKEKKSRHSKGRRYVYTFKKGPIKNLYTIFWVWFHGWAENFLFVVLRKFHSCHTLELLLRAVWCRGDDIYWKPSLFIVGHLERQPFPSNSMAQLRTYIVLVALGLVDRLLLLTKLLRILAMAI